MTLVNGIIFQQGAKFNNDIALLRFSQAEADKFTGMC